MLEAVLTQDVIENGDGFAIKQGVAKDRIISIEDSEMRHGRKSSQGKFNGYKADVMVDETSELITNVSVSPGNQPDEKSLDAMLASSTVKLLFRNGRYVLRHIRSQASGCKARREHDSADSYGRQKGNAFW